MPAHDRTLRRLVALEEELKETLLPLVEDAAKTGRQVFWSQRFNPWPQMRHLIGDETEELLKLADAVLALRAKLGEPEQCLASLLLRYCKKWGNLDDHHRGGPDRMAREFLVEYRAFRDGER